MEHNTSSYGSGYGTGTMEQQREQMKDAGARAFGQGEQMMERSRGCRRNAYYGAVLGSIGLSAMLFLMGKRNLGIFVGLWPPTLLNLALFTKQLRPSREMGEAKRELERM